MVDKKILANDWRAVGDDMRVAMGLGTRKLDANAIVKNNRMAFIDGVLSINPFGAPIKTIYMLPIFKTLRTNKR